MCGIQLKNVRIFYIVYNSNSETLWQSVTFLNNILIFNIFKLMLKKINKYFKKAISILFFVYDWKYCKALDLANNCLWFLTFIRESSYKSYSGAIESIPMIIRSGCWFNVHSRKCLYLKIYICVSISLKVTLRWVTPRST